MSIVTSFDSTEPGPVITLDSYAEVLRCLEGGTDKGLDKFAAVAKRHLRQMLPQVRLLHDDEEEGVPETRWVAHLTVVLDKTEATRLDQSIWRDKWASKLCGLVTRLAFSMMCDEPQDMSLVGSLRCNITQMSSVITVSVKQKWTFNGA